MKTLLRSLFIILALACAGPAVAVEAVVNEVDGRGNLILEFDSAPPGQPPGEIELTYRAGFMDMLLGRYRVVGMKGRLAEAVAVSVVSPPSQGMRVVVTLAQDAPLPSPVGAAAQEGKVVAVQGRAAEIEFPAGVTVRSGDRFSLAYLAPRVGRVAIQGAWRVDRVTGNRAHAEPEGTTGQPRVGQIVIPLAPAAPVDASVPSGPGGGLFQSSVDLKTLSFDNYLAEENHKEGMRLLNGDGVPVDRAKAMELLRRAAQLGHAGAQQQLDILEKTAVPAADSGVVARGWVGLVLQSLSPELAQTLGLAPDTQGSLVADVPASGPAEQAGIRPGDVILEIDGQPATASLLVEKVRQSTPGTLLRLWLWRSGTRLFIAVRVAKAP